ncbi:MAG: dioxygenase [Rhodocyclaceae bacterium]|nr:dioxygenase [Rhodocyclaceae bacterium]
MSNFPPLFISHGSPMLAIEPSDATSAWQALAQSLPQPRAILAVSAHWTTAAPAVSASAKPETIHDFYGFPPALYEIRYLAPGAVDLAQEVLTLIPQINIDQQRGLDHGAWMPLSAMYPQADIPVIQFAVMPNHSPEFHYSLGQQLAPLLSTGVMLLASGGLVHNLRDLVFDAPENMAKPYATAFRDWFVDALNRRDLPALFDYRRLAPNAAQAHPTEEHLLPIFVALGAAGENFATRIVYRGFSLGTLAMDSFAFDAA